jgi:hypothetical protein
MSKHTKATATLLALAALTAPSASARPAEDFLPNSVNAGGDEPAATSSPGGFDWGDAGIGAAAATLSLLGAGTGIALAGRRSRSEQAVS